MAEIISIILPVILILGLGWMCRRYRIVDDVQMSGIKTISVRFLWPAVLFYAFFTASYGREVILYAGVNFAANLIAFLIGLAIRKRTAEHSFSWPYLMSGFETGQIGYPLYGLLFKNQEISYLALLDVGHALFIFPIFLSYLQMEQSHEKNMKKAFRDMMTSPIMIALIVGMIAGVSGFGRFVMSGGAGVVINNIYSLVSGANTVMILLAMGYGISFTAEQIRGSIRLIVIRLIYYAVFAAAAIWFIGLFVPMNVYLLAAVLITFIMPPVYMLGVYVKDKEENGFMSTTASIYTIISIAAFMVITVVLRMNHA